ncbi:hypothetical protein A9HBioS_3788 [Pseudomonas koreensis]|uniref:Uncharacterized protein n=1 Tax=Pseudomonas koreensis TaxID=198620 RepID=A0AA94ELP3_9PSED|nr:hypothetical protein A9HBioS_3788 [Pseudomonas koreensis]
MKRDIFSELLDGSKSLADEREGKVKLRTTKLHLVKDSDKSEETNNPTHRLSSNQTHMTKL